MSESAKFGMPPKTESDYQIARGIIKMSLMPNADPSKGVPGVPKPPPGYVYESQQTGVFVSCVVLAVLVLVVTGLRIYLRLTVRRLRFGLDDVVIIPATLLVAFILLYSGAIAYMGGTGNHIFDLTYEQAYPFYTCTYVNTTVFFIAVGMVKISIALFLRRLTEMTQRAWRIAVDILIAVLVGYVLAALFANVFKCDPFRAGYDVKFAGTVDGPIRCTSTLARLNSLSIIHVVLDFVILTTPIIFLWKVKMTLGRRIRVCALFSVGLLSCICSGLRQGFQANVHDASWDNVRVLAWTNVDMVSAVLVASLPILNVGVKDTSAAKYVASSRLFSSFSGRTMDEPSKFESDEALRSELAGPDGRNYSASVHAAPPSELPARQADEDIEKNAIKREQNVKLTYLPKDEGTSDDDKSRHTTEK